MKPFVKPFKLILGHDYEIGYIFDIKVVWRLIQTTPKGYKFFNMKTSKCMRQPVMYPSKEPNHVGKGETWFFVSESLVVKEVFENQIDSNIIINNTKMKYKPQELKKYKHQALMNEFNDMMIRVKVHLFEKNDLKTSEIDLSKWLKPTNEELDNTFNKIMAVLREDSEPTIKY